MSFSSIAVEQREKETQALKSFLAFSLIGSLALHIGVLTFGINNLLSRAPQLEEEPMEVLIVDPPTVEATKPKEETQVEIKSSGGSGLVGSSDSGESGSDEEIEIASGSSGGSKSGTQSLPSSPLPVAARPLAKPAPRLAPSEPAVIAAKQPKQVATTPIKKVVENSKTEPAQTPPQKIATEAKPVIKPVAVSTSPKVAPTSQPVPVAVSQPPQSAKVTAPSSVSNENLREVLRGVRNSRESQGITANNTVASGKPNGTGDRSNIAAVSGNGTGTGTQNSGLGNGTGTGNGTGQGNGRGSGIGTGTGQGNGRGSGTGAGIGTGTGQGNGRGSGTGAGTGTGTGQGNGRGSGTGAGTGTGSGSGSGTGTGTGTGSIGQGNSRGSGTQGNGSTVATGSGSTRQRTTPRTSNANEQTGSGSNFLACRNCSQPKYPERARRRGVEGRTDLSVDVDGKGNVTNVRLANSSGNRELDQAAIRQARRWKFNAPTGVRRGLSAKVDFAIEGSERSRQLNQRQRQRTASLRNRLNTATTAASSAPTRRIRRSTGVSSAAASRVQTNNRASTSSSPRRLRQVSPRRQRVSTSSPTQRRRVQSTSRRRLQPATTSQRRLINSLRRQRVQTSAPRRLRQSQPVQRQQRVRSTRSPRRLRQATTPSQKKLINSLRSYRQQSQSAPQPANSPRSGAQ